MIYFHVSSIKDPLGWNLGTVRELFQFQIGSIKWLDEKLPCPVVPLISIP